MTSGSEIRIVLIDLIHPGASLRHHFAEAELDELARSIREKGVLQPLLVRPNGDGFELIAGERRWRAAQRAGLHDVPVIVREISDVEALEVALIENLQREDLSPFEEAEAYKRLMDLRGCSQHGLAAAIGKSRAHISNWVRLLSLPESVRRMVENGELSTGHAVALVVARDPAALAAEVAERGLDVHATERLVKRRLRPPRTPQRVAAAEMVELQDDLSARLGVRVKIVPKRYSGGTITLNYASRDQLDRVVALLRTDPPPIAAAA